MEEDFIYLDKPTEEHMSDSWHCYIDAAHRKIAIAAFHCKQLAQALKSCPSYLDSDRPDIATQAYFEGVVVAAIAAVDQVTQATNSALGLGASPGELFEKASPEIKSRVPEFNTWCDQPIGLDLRRLRDRIVHYSYDKQAKGNLLWQVETTGTNYNGPRDLLNYATAAAEHAKELGSIANKLQESLVASSNAG